jgi:hypothetical protein
MNASDRLAEVTYRVARLRPDWRNHERYFEERGEIERELRNIVHELQRGERRG